VGVGRRRGLLDLDANAVAINVDREADHIAGNVEGTMHHCVRHDLGDREPQFIEAAVEHLWRKGVVENSPGALRGAVVGQQDRLPAH
jgi:hypothetical protein